MGEKGYERTFSMSREELSKIIKKTARNQEEEAILSDRILDGATYQKIADRYYDGMRYRFDEFRYGAIIRKKVNSLLNKFYKNVSGFVDNQKT